MKSKVYALNVWRSYDVMMLSLGILHVSCSTHVYQKLSVNKLFSYETFLKTHKDQSL